MSKKAIVTLIIGSLYVKQWKKYAMKSWQVYADKYGYDLIVIDEFLDSSDRAKKRSISWQKCLIFNSDKVSKYEKVLWLDSDVIINHNIAPDICEGVDDTKIGCVDAYSFYHRENYDFYYQVQIEKWHRKGVKAIVNRKPEEYYQSYGFDTDIQDVVQCGVLLLNPELHKAVLEKAYSYEDLGGPEWNYEMRPLSYEITSQGYHEFVSERFNYPFSAYKSLFHPKIAASRRPHIFKKRQLIYAATSAFLNSYFLHFAACQNQMKFVDQSKRTLLDF